MIPEDRQDLAALYVLGSLNAEETTEFETALHNDAELRALVRELRESAAAIAHSAPSEKPSAALKQRVLRDIAVEKTSGNAGTGKPSSAGWLPWTIAALFLVFSGILLYDRAQLRRELTEVRARDPLAGVSFVALAPQKDAPAGAKAVVAWQSNEQEGVIRVTGLPVISGKDYQLWAVDEDHPDPVSAGIIHVNDKGEAEVRFKPIAQARRVKAFAISVEREGGVPKAEGPIILVGSTT